MNTKKLIGTIVGVTAFIALVAGATFAWLTITANVTNATYTGTSKNFVINYVGGSAVNNIPQISNGNASHSNITSASSASETTDSWLAVTASKLNTSAKAEYFKVTLHIDTNTLSSNSLMYAACKEGTCPSSSTALASVSSGSAICASANVTCGIINGGSDADVILINDTSTFNTLDTVSNTTYNIYFWLNMNTMTESDLGKNFIGHITAEARQGE